MRSSDTSRFVKLAYCLPVSLSRTLLPAGQHYALPIQQIDGVCGVSLELVKEGVTGTTRRTFRVLRGLINDEITVGKNVQYVPY